MFMGFTTPKNPWSSLEAMNFIYGMPAGHFPPEDKEIHAWQCAARTLLDSLVTHRDTKTFDARVFRRLELAFALGYLGHAVPGADGRSCLVATGPALDVFRFLCYILLSMEPSNRILRCPECQTIFYRVRRQQYCSPACTNKVICGIGGRHPKGRSTKHCVPIKTMSIGRNRSSERRT